MTGGKGDRAKSQKRAASRWQIAAGSQQQNYGLQDYRPLTTRLRIIESKAQGASRKEQNQKQGEGVGCRV